MSRYSQHQVTEKVCSHKDCTASYTPHYWGSIKAQNDGWFIQQGTQWCKKHHPSWVAEWRKKQKAKTKTRARSSN